MDPQIESASEAAPAPLPTMADLDALAADLDTIDQALADLDQTNPDRREQEAALNPRGQ